MLSTTHKHMEQLNMLLLDHYNIDEVKALQGYLYEHSILGIGGL